MVNGYILRNRNFYGDLNERIASTEKMTYQDKKMQTKKNKIK